MEESRKQIAKKMKERIAIRQAYCAMILSSDHVVSFGDVSIAVDILKAIKDREPDMFYRVLASLNELTQ